MHWAQLLILKGIHNTRSLHTSIYVVATNATICAVHKIWKLVLQCDIKCTLVMKPLQLCEQRLKLVLHCTHSDNKSWQFHWNLYKLAHCIFSKHIKCNQCNNVHNTYMKTLKNNKCKIKYCCNWFNMHHMSWSSVTCSVCAHQYSLKWATDNAIIHITLHISTH